MTRENNHLMTPLPPKIVLVGSKEHQQGVRDALGFIKDDLKQVLAHISSLTIKVNMVITRTLMSIHGMELATTPVNAVRSFIDFIAPFYSGEIIIAEGSTMGNTKTGFRIYGFTELAKENPKIKLLDLRDDEVVDQKLVFPGGEITLPLSKTLMNTPLLVSIARPKTHNSVLVTAAIKNVLVGSIRGNSKRNSLHLQGAFIHHILTAIAESVYPDLAIIDGTIGMEGDGPLFGQKINSGWAVASFDALGADSLAAYLMGFDPNDIGYLKLLHHKGFGLLYPDHQRTVTGEKPELHQVPYQPHQLTDKVIMEWNQVND